MFLFVDVVAHTAEVLQECEQLQPKIQAAEAAARELAILPYGAERTQTRVACPCLPEQSGICWWGNSRCQSS